MTHEKTSRLKDIKDTMLFGLQIFHQLRAPEVQHSVGKISDTSIAVKEIIEYLKTPEMVKNIENFRIISENINDATTKIQNAINQLEETGIIEDTKGLINSAKSTAESIMENGQGIHEIRDNMKETFKSVRTLVKVLKIITVS